VSYQHLPYSSLNNESKRQIFEHTDMLLHDVYGILRMLPPEDEDGGGGNFSVALILLCILDGLATSVWPTRDVERSPKKRFKRLIRERLPWGPEGKGKWVDIGTAAAQLYAELRNPLVHQLALDTGPKTRSRPASYEEPGIGPWGKIPESLQDITVIDSMSKWDDAWPVFYEQPDRGPRYKLATAPLYWATKRTALDMISDCLSLSQDIEGKAN